MHKSKEKNYAEISQDEGSFYLEARINREDLPKAVVAGVGGALASGFFGAVISEASALISDGFIRDFTDGAGESGVLAGFAVGAYVYLRHKNLERAAHQQAQSNNSTSTPVG